MAAWGIVPKTRYPSETSHGLPSHHPKASSKHILFNQKCSGPLFGGGGWEKTTITTNIYKHPPLHSPGVVVHWHPLPFCSIPQQTITKSYRVTLPTKVAIDSQWHLRTKPKASTKSLGLPNKAAWSWSKAFHLRKGLLFWKRKTQDIYRGICYRNMSKHIINIHIYNVTL